MAAHSSILAGEAHGQGSLAGCGPRGRKEADASGHTARTVPGAVPSTGVNHPSNITPSNTQHTAGREGTASSPLDRRWEGGAQSHQLLRTQGGPSSNRGPLATAPHLHALPLGVCPQAPSPASSAPALPAAEDTGWSKLKPRPSGHCPPPPRPPSRCLPAGTQPGQLCPCATSC